MNLTSLDLPELPKVRSGKVREVFDLGPEIGLLLVASDRISAFDCVFAEPIPDKGRVLNALSAFWFRYFSGQKDARGELGPNQFRTDDFGEYPSVLQPYRRQIEGRSMIVRATQPLPVECVVRGYLAGSGWEEYKNLGTVGGYPLPDGLQMGQRIPEPFYPLFTPARKSEEGHDENLTSWKAFVDLLLGNEELAKTLRQRSISTYVHGSQYAQERGIIIADTKFEFGIDAKNREVLLIDECLTPDSSRFWPAEGWEVGENPPSFDKQYLRDYLSQLAWNKRPPAPDLPEEVVRKTSEKYRAIYQMLTGYALLEVS